VNDLQYRSLPRPSGGLDHGYGPRVHILSEPYPMSMLARLCAETTVQPQVNDLVGALYDWMLAEVSSALLLTTPVELPTRMARYHPAEGVYRGEAIDRGQRVVVVDIARAGILPSHRMYHGLHHLIEAENLRQDHIVSSRATDADQKVIGVQMDSTKIGGPVGGATVIIPDPMAATGSSIAAVINSYLNLAGGAPRVIAAVHLIVTPEYIRRMTAAFPALEIFAIRVDRGLSSPEALEARPGDLPDQERGLNERHYIVPGAGGVGEVLNNAWI
jgi:uracil phosphoribosyltransferase